MRFNDRVAVGCLTLTAALARKIEPARASTMKRAKLRGLKRNAAVVLGNVGAADDVAVLARALHDGEPLVCEHAAWALQRLGIRHPDG